MYQGVQKKIDSGYVVLVEPGKSQTWATALALEKGLKPGCALRLGEEGSNMLGYSLEGLSSKIRRKVGKTKNIVIVDDGSFTGNQMANNISGASRILETVYGHKKHEFHVIVPFVTKPAAKKLFSLKQKVHLYTSPMAMKSVAEVIPAKYLDRGLKLLGLHKSRASSAALTYFSHKIPNSMSFPKALADGGFIPDFPPPYKRVQEQIEESKAG